MPNIQQVSSIGASHLPISQKTTIQGSFPVVAVKSAAAKHLSSTAASGISDQQGVSARTVSTKAFLGKIGIKTKSDSAAATMSSSSSSSSPDSASGSVVNSMSESVTAKAGVVAKNRGVVHITPCVNDYYILNNNNTVTHRLVNICERTTFVSGYVDPKCSIAPSLNNPFSVFALSKQGDLYTVETHIDNCEQAIQTAHPDSLPAKLGDCLYDFRTRDDEQTLFEDKVTNVCKDKVAHGYVDANCQLSVNASNPSASFTLNPSETLTIKTNYFCNKAVYEGKTPPIKVGDCFHDFVTPNNNGTATHKVINICYTLEHGYLRKNCTVNPSPSNNEWNHFGLSQDAEISFLIQDKKDCKKPIRLGHPSVASYEKLYCPSKNASLADLPKAEKIVAGDGLLSPDARHLVYIANRGVNFCTGSLISNRHVLTAAHCLKDRRASKQSAALENLRVHHDPLRIHHNPYPRFNGIQYIPKNEHRVKAVHLAPCYVYSQQNNCDLALFELEKPVVNGRFLSLPTDQDFCEFAKEVDRVLATDTAFPYDLTGQYDKTQSVWQEGNALAQGFGRERDSKGNTVLSGRAKQGKLVAFKIAGNDGVISTKPNNKGDNVCSGDSGGPLIHKAKDGRKVQVGVTCCFDDEGYKQCSGGTSYTNLHNKEHRTWLEERMAEDPKSVKIKSGDLTRLRVSPDSCVEKNDAADGFLSWLGIQSKRKITYTNNCHNKNHPTKVNINLYLDQNNKNKQENSAQLDLGETRVFQTDGAAAKTVLTWSDLE